jgi:hypothetical protein
MVEDYNPFVIEAVSLLRCKCCVNLSLRLFPYNGSGRGSMVCRICGIIYPAQTPLQAYNTIPGTRGDKREFMIKRGWIEKSQATNGLIR